jgi:hypothetical protein
MFIAMNRFKVIKEERKTFEDLTSPQTPSIRARSVRGSSCGMLRNAFTVGKREATNDVDGELLLPLLIMGKKSLSNLMRVATAHVHARANLERKKSSAPTSAAPRPGT